MSKLTITDIQEILSVHTSYWDANKPEMNSLTRMLKQELFTDQSYLSMYAANDQIIEPAAAYAFIEGYIASLFPKAPAVIVGPDIKQQGNAEVVEQVANRFLYDQCEIIQRVMRNALVYPFSFLKLALDTNAESVVDQVQMKPVFPWDVVLDFDAETFESCRYVGHRYWLPISEARSRFSGIKFTGEMKKDFLSNVQPTQQKGKTSANSNSILSYVEIFEIYDFMNDQLIFYSTNADRTDKVIDRIDPIPFRKYNGRPLSPLVPMYFDYAIDVPLQGASALRRVFDTVVELINVRTIWANGIRKEARQMVAKKGTFSEEAKAIYNQNIDGAILEVELMQGESLSQAMMPIPIQPIPSDFSIYEGLIERDLNAGSVLAPFTKGVATNASATEVAALTQYSASEIGKMARIRDRAIEYLAEVYTSLVAFLLVTGDNDKETISIDGKPEVVSAKDFIGKFKFSAADQANTPIGSAMKKATIAQLIGPLEALGVEKAPLLEYIVRTFDLPDNFIPQVQNEETAQQTQSFTPPDSLGAAQETPEALPVGGGQVASNIRATV